VVADTAKKEKETKDRNAKKQNREKAAQQIDRDISTLRGLFDAKAKGRADAEQQRREQEELQKQRLSRKNARLARTYAEKKQYPRAPGGSVDTAAG
jgi:uncharacterized protein (DUF3084 family)